MHLHPAEHYLRSWTMRRELKSFKFYDGHVYSVDIMEEWLGELKEVVKWYLALGCRWKYKWCWPMARL